MADNKFQPVPVDHYRVDPPSFGGIASVDSSANGGYDKAAAKPIMKALNARIERLQENLYAHGKEKLLVVLQATDTGGKDGVALLGYSLDYGFGLLCHVESPDPNRTGGVEL